MEKEPSLTEKIGIVTRVYSAVKSHFGHWENIPRYSLDNCYQELLSTVVQNPPRREFCLALMKFLAGLKNGHTWLTDPCLTVNLPENPGFEFECFHDGWFISRSCLPGCEPGDMLTSLDHVPFEDFYLGLRAYIGGSSERERRSKLSGALHLFPIRFALQLLDPGGKEKNITVDLETVSPLPRKDLEHRWLVQEKAAYISLPHFGNPSIEDRALDLIEHYADSSAMVLDIRGNIGGATPERLVRKLMKKPYRWWSETAPLLFSYQEFLYDYFDSVLRRGSSDTAAVEELTDRRDNHSIFRRSYLKWCSDWQAPHPDPYRGSVLLLTDRLTRSAGEDMAMPFADNGGGVLIGERTSGTTGQPYILQFKDGLSIYIGLKRAFFPDGGVFEGVGITPHIEFERTAESLRSSDDAVLAKAVETALELTRAKQEI